MVHNQENGYGVADLGDFGRHNLLSVGLDLVDVPPTEHVYNLADQHRADNYCLCDGLLS